MKEGGRLRAVQMSANEEEVEKLVLKGRPPVGDVPQLQTGFQDFRETRDIPVLSPQ